MKKSKFIIAIALLTVMATAWKVADDIITRLGMQQQNAQYYIINNFIGRFDTGPMDQGVEDGPANSVYKQLQSFRIPTAKLLPAIISGDKAGAAKELCEYIKKYINSIEFTTEYDKLRESAMPLVDRGMSLANLKRSKEVHQKNINNYKTDIKYVAEQQEKLDEVQKRIDAMVIAAKNPFPGKETWTKLYPANPAIIIKARLQEYLQVSATVDFNAKLTGTGKRQTFVNPAYEKKSLKWKAIFRAGKEVNEVVTAFVKEWLKGEIIAAEKTTMTADVQQKTEEKQLPTSNANVSSPTPAASADTNAVTAEEPARKKTGLKKLKEKAGSILRY